MTRLPPHFPPHFTPHENARIAVLQNTELGADAALQAVARASDVKGRTKLVYERARAIARVYGTKAAFILCPNSSNVLFL